MESWRFWTTDDLSGQSRQIAIAISAPAARASLSPDRSIPTPLSCAPLDQWKPLTLAQEDLP